MSVCTGVLLGPASTLKEIRVTRANWLSGSSLKDAWPALPLARCNALPGLGESMLLDLRSEACVLPLHGSMWGISGITAKSLWYFWGCCAVDGRSMQSNARS
eukprot:6214805-Pleurochrysis_carterae.AAC.1